MRPVRVPGSVELKVSAALGAGNRGWASFVRERPQNLQVSRVCGVRDADWLHLSAFGGLLVRLLSWLSLGPVALSPPPAVQARPPFAAQDRFWSFAALVV